MARVGTVGRLSQSYSGTTREPHWIRWWCFAAWIPFCVELFVGGVSDRPEGAGWLEGKGPLVAVAVGVVALVVFAGLWVKREERSVRGTSDAGTLGIGRCPAWFGYTALGLAIIGFVFYAYAGFRSLGTEGSVHALQRRAAVLLLVGSSCLFELILYFSDRSREAGKARMDGGPALSPPST